MSMDLLEGGGRSSHNMSVAPSGLERVEGAHNQGGSLVEKYIHRENLSLFKKRSRIQTRSEKYS
jgi:hypothetical protein